MSSFPAVQPLAPPQETLWEFTRFFLPHSPGALGINACEGLTLRGELRIDLLRSAIADVVAQHDALRSVFLEIDDTPRLRYLPEVEPPLTLVDVAGVPEPERTRRMRLAIGSAEDGGFDVLAAPLWRVVLVRVAAREHVLIVSLCHLIADGWSAHLMLRDIGTAYGFRQDRGDDLTPVPSYAEIAPGTRPTGERRRAASDYWRRSLRPLPLEPVFPSVDRSATVGPGIELKLHFTLPDDLADGLVAYAKANRTTPYLSLMGAYRALLGAMTSRDRIVIGTTTVGREPRARNVVGQFTTNTYVATRLGRDASLAETVRAVHDQMLLAMRYAAPYGQIASAAIDDFARRRPWPMMHLYDVWFQSDLPPRLPSFPGLEVAPAPDGLAGPSPEVPARPDDPDWVAVARKRVTPWFLIRQDCRGGHLAYGPAYFEERQAIDLVNDLCATVAALLRDSARPIRELGR